MCQGEGILRKPVSAKRRRGEGMGGRVVGVVSSEQYVK